MTVLALLALSATSFAAPLDRPAAACKRPRQSPVKMIGKFFENLYESVRVTQEIPYELLQNDPESIGGEAAAWALAGQVPTKTKDGYEVATFAGGCFWGTELHYQRLPGVVRTCVGYTQGDVEKPTYSEVCTGGTKHTEAIFLCFDPAVCSYEALCEKLLSTVDPTALNRVGNDRGTQYRHGIYPHTDAQAAVAKRVLAAEQGQQSRPVVTEMKRAAVFWPAEPYHQRYLEKGGQSAEENAPERVRCYG